MKVENMKSARGNKVANQFIINGAFMDRHHPKDGGVMQGTMFQSYDSNIVFVPYNSSFKTLLDKTFWDHSATTGRYRNQFLGEGIAETRKKIESGEYKLVNLN